MATPTIGGAQFWADRRYRLGWRVQELVLRRSQGSGRSRHRLLDPLNRRHSSGTLAHCVATLNSRVLAQPPKHVVVVLHGLGRSSRSMSGMATALRGAGLEAIALDYPSTRRSIDEHVAQIAEVLTHLDGVEEVSFVTHSLGGIIARGVLARNLPVTPIRLVMLAPPSRGASLARVLHSRVGGLFGMVMGPAGRQLATHGNEELVPVPTIPFMVVAGHRAEGINPLIEGADDGIVSVEETKLEGMQEHLVVESVHTVLMNHPDAQRAAIRFLKAPR